MTDRATRGQEPASPSGADYVGRFAPSPTGRLHLGHAWSAILAHDAARAAGGRFVLRIDDLDAGRARPDHIAAIIADLAWLGLGWDAVVMQSARLDAYAAAFDRLNALDLAYPCFCTRRDIARAVAASLSAPHGANGPVYPGTCRALTAGERAARLATGAAHCWRFDSARAAADAGAVSWHDANAGVVTVDPGALGDIILRGRDAPASYHLACVIDDAAFAISEVVRGDDIFASTHAQVLLQRSLGLATPRYRHHALIAGADGARLAKRHGAPTLEDVRIAREDGRALADRLRAAQLPIGFAFTTRYTE